MIDQWKAIALTPDRQLSSAGQAMERRPNPSILPRELLTSRRRDDDPAPRPPKADRRLSQEEMARTGASRVEAPVVLDPDQDMLYRELTNWAGRVPAPEAARRR
jgi:hypothetical protein